MLELNRPEGAYMDHLQKWNACQLCEIGGQAFKHVFPRGEIPCDYLFIGEGPGASEDTLGEPFVGPSGQLLERALQKAGFDKYRLCFTNLLLCRPQISGENRTPTNFEIHNCSARLQEFVNLAEPARGIIFLGAVPFAFSDLISYHVRRWKRKHPAYVLRKGSFAAYVSHFKEILKGGSSHGL